MQTKLIKCIQMILVTLIVIVVAATIVGILSNNNAMAYSEGKQCSVCDLNPVDYIKTEFYMTHTTYYVCRNCHYKTEKTEKCTLTNFKKIDENKHEAQCKQCQDCYVLSHVDADKNGRCDDCSAVISQNTPDNHICLDHSKEKIVVFDNAYHDYYAICTLCKDPVPDWQKREAHSFGEYTSKGSVEHSRTCKICGYELIQAHNYQNGKCVCGQEEPIEIKIKSEKYKIDDTYISNVQPKASVNEFKSNIETNGTEINIYNKDNKLVSGSTKIGTGMKIEIKSGDEKKIFTIAVNGDVNGDGDVDFNDIVKMNQARLKKQDLDKIYSLAADVTGDEKVDFKDIVKINQFRLNKVTEL